MEWTGQRRARSRLHGAVRERTDRCRVELRRAGHARLPGRPVQARHGAAARSARGARRGERRGGADRSRMPRGGVGDATGTVLNLFPAPAPRARGENARLTHQQQTIEAELATAITKPGDSLDRPAEEAYATEVRQLSWSNPTIASRSRPRPRPGSKTSPPPLRRSAPTRGRGPRAAIAPCRRPAGNSKRREQRGKAPPCAKNPRWARC